MGNKNSYCRLLPHAKCSSNKKGKLCIVYQDKVYIDFTHNDSTIVSKYYLPDRNIGFHILEDILYVYSSDEPKCHKDIKKDIILPKKLYDKIIEMYTLMEQKKIKSVYLVDELKRLNNYNTFTITV